MIYARMGAIAFAIGACAGKTTLSTPASESSRLPAAAANASAPASPTPPAAPHGTPIAAIPCVSGPPTLAVANGRPVLCDTTGACIALDGSGARPIAKPADDPHQHPEPATIQREPSPRLCMATRCVPLGRALAKALADPSADGPASSIPATADLRTVLLGDELWNVAGDRKIPLPPPPRQANERTSPEGFSVNGMTPVGNAVRIEWINCAAEGCVRSAMVDSAGHDLHQNIDGVDGDAVKLTDDLYVQLSVWGDAQLLDRSGHLRSHRELAKEDLMVPLGLVRLADDRFAVLTRLDATPTGYLVHVVSVSAQEPTIYDASAQYIAQCDDATARAGSMLAKP
jgi:hypothetical protein